MLDARAYYNEIDPNAAAWLRELIKQGHIADGDVDERSIEDVFPSDLKGYTQCHFFAGIGVWSYALRSAAIGDGTPLWTGSPPCQSFSAAGAGKGMDDLRHLWPAWHHLIRECRPGIILGEQVEAAIGFGWLDLVQSDLEGEGYAFGAVPSPAGGFGAPHLRHRVFYGAEKLAHAEGNGRHQWRSEPEGRLVECRCSIGELGDTPSAGLQMRECSDTELHGLGPNETCLACRVANTVGSGQSGPSWCGCAQEQRITECGMPRTLAHAKREQREGADYGPEEELKPHGEGFADKFARPSADAPTGPTNGFWGDVDWLLCREGKWRPVEPGTFPLAHGSPARVVRLRGYGNAINAEQARAFITAFFATRRERSGLDLV